MILYPFLWILNINIEAKIGIPNFMHKNNIVNPLSKDLKMLKIEIKCDSRLKLGKLKSFRNLLKILLLSILDLNIMWIKNNSIILLFPNNKQRLIANSTNQATKRFISHQSNQMIKILCFNTN